MSRGWKDDFDLGATTYLNGANHGPFPRVTLDAVARAVEWKRDPSSLDDATYFTLPDRIRRAAAPFFRCRPRELAVTCGASTGINLVASGLDWRHGDHVIVPAGEFPATYLPWLALRERGVEVEVLDTGGPRTAAAVEAALTPRTRLVAVGHVNFATGFRVDVEALGALCREREALLVVDASQSACAMPLDVGRWGAVVVAAAGYKWMCSPYGTGLFWVHPDWVERLPVPVVNWEAVEGADDFNRLTDLELRYRPGAVRFDAPETASFLNGSGMAASLEFLGDIGAEAALAHSTALLDRLVEGLPAGYRVDSSLEAAHRSTIIRVVGPDPAATRAAHRRCRERRISVSMRENGIRVSPGVWNDDADVDRLLEALEGGPAS